MWPFLWGIFAVFMGLLFMLTPGNPPRADWQKLPTLTPTPSEVRIDRSRKLPTLTPTPGDRVGEQPRVLPTLTPTPEGVLAERPRHLPTLTPTPTYAIQRVDHVVAEWPLEVSSVPIQPASGADPLLSQTPATFSSTLSE